MSLLPREFYANLRNCNIFFGRMKEHSTLSQMCKAWKVQLIFGREPNLNKSKSSKISQKTLGLLCLPNFWLIFLLLYVRRITVLKLKKVLRCNLALAKQPPDEKRLPICLFDNLSVRQRLMHTPTSSVWESILMDLWVACRYFRNFLKLFYLQYL